MRFGEIAENPDYGNSLCNLALVHEDLGDYETALQFYHEAVALFEKLDDQESVARILLSIGLTYRASKNFEMAVKYFERTIVLMVIQQLEKSPYYFHAMLELVSAYIFLGNQSQRNQSHEQAIKYYKLGLKYCHAANEKSGNVSNLHTGIGLSYAELGKPKLALFHMQEAQKIAIQLFGAKSAAAIGSVNNIAFVRARNGDNGLAASLYQQSMRQIERLIPHTNRTEIGELYLQTLDGLAAVLYNLGQIKESSYYIQKYVPIIINLLPKNSEKLVQLKKLNDEHLK